jgi:PAS domain-containing protein
MEVSDARRDGRFSSNPLVTSKAAIRFYAGAPLRLNNGSRIGTLCVLDREPKKLDARQKEALQHLSIVVVEALKRRRATLARQPSDSATDSAESISQEGTWEWNVLDGQLIVNDAWATILGCEPQEQGSIDIEYWLGRLVATDRTRFKDMLQRLASGTVEKIEGEFELANAHAGRVRIQAHVHLWTVDNRPEWIFGTQVDLSARQMRQESIPDGASALEATQSSEPIDTWHFDIATKTMSWGSQVCLLCGVSPGYQPEFSEFLRFYPDEARLKLERAFNRAIGLGESFDLTLAFFRPDGETTTVRVIGVPEFDDSATPVRVAGSLADIRPSL